MEEWDRYFKDLLGGMSRRVIRGTGGRAGEDKEERLTRKEIKEILREMKVKKAVGIDRMPAKVWKESRWKNGRICDRIWVGEG